MSALLRLIGWTLAVALVVLPVVAVLKGWVGQDQWPLTRLRATGEFERVDPAALQRALMPYAKQGFFAVKLDDARAAVAALPWVEHAEVRKRWPDVLEVTVVEHRPFARWGEERVLSEQGRLFPSEGIEVPDTLPWLDGPDTRVSDVVRFYNESRSLFAPLGIAVRQVELDARGSWSLGLGNGAVVMVGRSQPGERLQRFIRVIPQLVAQNGQLPVRADLRYTNGFSLTWASGDESADTDDASAATGARPALNDRTGLAGTDAATRWTASTRHERTEQILQQVNI
ncbi:cell division protein FtsQ/DivIB [Marilutibacter alkalisoli]|uniref:Cell division protein FtsQ n=1 Tax=Marilutibacter alkalisoli TaxID=2591633 RepID=A0A514BU76_9GAMM|nr:cell division protein FtsQ/DivIB [Lysobacter alkalisoli]QDH70951.1 FtsQ-type POTRA domain-containing protein [Lysobacter alkalisoli]